MHRCRHFRPMRFHRVTILRHIARHGFIQKSRQQLVVHPETIGKTYLQVTCQFKRLGLQFRAFGRRAFNARPKNLFVNAVRKEIVHELVLGKALLKHVASMCRTIKRKVTCFVAKHNTAKSLVLCKCRHFGDKVVIKLFALRFGQFPIGFVSRQAHVTTARRRRRIIQNAVFFTQLERPLNCFRSTVETVTENAVYTHIFQCGKHFVGQSRRVIFVLTCWCAKYCRHKFVV